MTPAQLQVRLRASGRYTGAVDGKIGPVTQAAIMTAMTDGPDTKLVSADYVAAAQELEVAVSAIRAVSAVEAAGDGFYQGRPTILFEPHRFSKVTKGRFDRSHPMVSYPDWDPKRYPGSQAGRYAQLVTAVALDVDHGFASASYGRFQILGENYVRAGFQDTFSFAEAHAYDERTQLLAFVMFVAANAGMARALRDRDFDTFARLYNGPAWRKNDYGNRLRAADKRFQAGT